MNRRDFLSGRPKTDKTTLVEPLARTQTGLAPYSGAWSLSEVKHLLRRTRFGASKAECDHYLSIGLSGALTELLTPLAVQPAPPLYTGTAAYNDPNVPFGQTWVNAAYDSLANFQRLRSFRAWWAGLMLQPDPGITERMVLFWHNHFVTEASTLANAVLGYRNNALLRQHALGNFKTLTREVTRDPGMLRYLNGYLNTASAPDENYGRELQELFTVGKDANGQPYYTEDDVKNAAKVLTGYRIDLANGTSYFDPARHDTSDKVFSAYYNNTVITGRSGTAGQDELDDLLDMIFAKQEVALHLARKLYRFFVYYEIDASTESNVIQPLADVFRNNNYEIIPALQALLGSEHFFDLANRGALIKTPIDFVVSHAKDFGVTFPDAASLEDQYSQWYRLYTLARDMGQNIGDPPDVAGWPAYYSSPAYHELWINATTLPARNAFTDRMVANGYTSGSSNISFDVVAYTSDLANASDPNLLIQEVLDRHYCFDPSQTLKDYLKSFLLSGQAQDHYWTDAWDDYLTDPTNTIYYGIVESRLRGMYQYLMNLAEYQLS
jgi:uncharacterized protein (DUF1800 family)